MFHSQHFHFGHSHGPFFRKGDFKYVILELLKDKPRYGYEIIRELEERFQGFYTPSPGIVYPTLQYLEELGYVTAEVQEGKKVYTITEAGRKFLEEKSEAQEDLKDRMKGWWETGMRQELRDLMHEMRRLAWLLRQYGRKVSKEQIGRAREVMAKASRDIEEILSK
jgi:DNA-binding PadR family transcriptional regulator